MNDRRLERWSADSGHRDVVRLDIPPDASRERSFEIFVSLVVDNQLTRDDAMHGMRVLVDGALEWARNVPTPSGGADSLELRLRRSVPVGRPLRLVAMCKLHGVLRTSLGIVAEEEARSNVATDSAAADSGATDRAAMDRAE